MSDTLRICEIFCSIQGESTYQGLPCNFIRLSGCNLSCRYCDTPYSRYESEEMTVSRILKHLDAEITLTEITGGEPLLQPQTPELMERLLRQDRTVLLETNGSISLADVPEKVVKIMDIKSPGSGMNGRMLPENLSLLNKKDEIKMVLCSREDYLWAKKTVKEYGLHQICTVLFSPASPGPDASALADWIVEDRLPVRLNLQLHKTLWGPSSRK